VLYQIKLHGFNPLNWKRRASKELQRPKPLITLNEKRRGRLNLEDTENLFALVNIGSFVRWIWVWLK
jgi:amino acid transporter